MLYIPRWKAIAILLTAGICCLFAIPNLLPEKTVQRWPAWAQRHIVLGLDLQGGSHILLQVDANDVRRQKLQTLQDDVRRLLREAPIGLTRAATIRGNSVEVVVRDNQIDQALAKLRELSQPLGGFAGSTGQRSIEIVNAGGGLIRLTVTEPALVERTRQVVDQSVEIIERRVNAMGLVEPSIQRQGADRVLVQVPGLGNPEELIKVIGTAAKAYVPTGRHLDVSGAGAAGAPAAQFGDRLRDQSRKPPAVSAGKARDRVRRGAHRCPAPEFDQRTSEPIVSFKFNTSGARKFAQVTQENVGRPFAIVLDEEVISAPVIREPILGGAGQISGSFTVESANNLAILLRAGALPAKLTVIEQRVVGAGLGQRLHREGKDGLVFRGRARCRVHGGDLRDLRRVRDHCGGDQRRHDLRDPVVPQCNAHIARDHRHRADYRHRG